MDSLTTDLEAVPTITIVPSHRRGLPSLLMTASVSWGDPDGQGQLLSVSVNVDMVVARVSGLEAALLFLLYDLDSKVAAAKGWGS